MPHAVDPNETALRLIELFAAGDLAPKLSRILLLSGDFPALRWSWLNRFLVAIEGRHPDARGYRQWQQVGRQVRRGESAIRIFAPRLVRDRHSADSSGADLDDTAPLSDASEQRLAGWLKLPVFTYLQTEGEPLPDHAHAERHLERLPLRAVATAWGLSVTPFHLEGAIGLYSRGAKRIQLATESTDVWLHELVHAADDRLTGLAGDRSTREIVAEFGAQILLGIFEPDFRPDTDSFAYLTRFAHAQNRTAMEACMAFLTRTCAAVTHILDTAEGLRDQPVS